MITLRPGIKEDGASQEGITMRRSGGPPARVVRLLLIVMGQTDADATDTDRTQKSEAPFFMPKPDRKKEERERERERERETERGIKGPRGGGEGGRLTTTVEARAHVLFCRLPFPCNNGC